jgi:glycosyltransferase involved in cell wall biosynthesis
MKISVVLAVYNGEARLAPTLDSILGQTEQDLELIVIDDGSSDSTPSILRRYSDRDDRIVVLQQRNSGLTKSLIRGCAAARAPIIARHDCGDVSHPRRFERQVIELDDPAVALASCSVQFRAPTGERLYEAHANGDEIRAGLLRAGASSARGLPHHGTAMFRRDTYVSAGGYREEFRYAQDLDLWMRIAALGRIVVIPELFYEAFVELGTVSMTARAQQVELTQIAVLLRDNPSGAPELLRRAASIVPKRKRNRLDDARASYFIASCLLRNGDRAWRAYARNAIRSYPLHFRSWVLFLRALRPFRRSHRS